MYLDIAWDEVLKENKTYPLAKFRAMEDVPWRHLKRA